MMFIVRRRGDRPTDLVLAPGVRIALVRKTPSIVAEHDDQIDLFCVADDAAPDRLRSDGHTVVLLRDGWYQADDAGGVAIWGQGLYWEVRDTPFSVKEAAGPGSDGAPSEDIADEANPGEVNVRRAIFGV
jgi:hypothetical protein